MSNDTISTGLLSARGLAADLGVTSATVRRWVRTGKLVPTLITYGGYYKFDLDDAKQQLEAQRFIRNRDYRAAHDIHTDAENETHSQHILDTDE